MTWDEHVTSDFFMQEDYTEPGGSGKEDKEEE